MSELTVVEARELVTRHWSGNGRPQSAAFVENRRQNRARRRQRGLPAPSHGDWQGIWDEFLPPMAGGASSFNVIVDTTAPGGAALALNGGASYATSVDITAALTTTDNPVTGYQILIWGDVNPAFNASIQTTQGASAWISPTWTGTGPFTASQAVRLAAGDALKTINARIRDDVWNETATLTKTITLDTVVPVVTIQTGPDATKISTIAGKRTVNFTWQSDSAYTAYEVAVVANSASVRGSGTVIGTANGSTNVSGGAGPALTNVSTSIDGRDIQAASAGDGTKVVKIFVQDAAGNWSA